MSSTSLPLPVIPSQTVTFASLFRDSVLFQGALAVMCVAGTFALLLLGREVPQNIWLLDFMVGGFFFGARNLLTARNGEKDANATTQILAHHNADLSMVLAQMGGMSPAAFEGLRPRDYPPGYERPVGHSD